VKDVGVADRHTGAKGFNRAPNLIDQEASTCDERFTSVDDRQVRLRFVPSMHHRAQQLGIDSS